MVAWEEAQIAAHKCAECRKFGNHLEEDCPGIQALSWRYIATVVLVVVLAALEYFWKGCR